jgi:hypothetical protein
MESLSTEIDEKIIRRLPQGALNTMSRVSKGYHALTEPYLYRDVVLSDKQSLDTFRLLFTILKRKDLVKYIISFTLTSDNIDHTTQTFHQSFFEELLDTATEVKDLLKEVAAPLDNKQHLVEWYGTIYAPFGELGTQAMLQSALALILCAATNLKSLSLSGDICDISRWALEHCWNDNPQNTEGSYAFYRLRTLHIGKNVKVVIQPSVEDLYIDHTSQGYFTWQPLQNDMVYSLRKLDLVDVRFDTVWLESAISSPVCTGLEELCINHANADSSS